LRKPRTTRVFALSASILIYALSFVVLMRVLPGWAAEIRHDGGAREWLDVVYGGIAAVLLSFGLAWPAILILGRGLLHEPMRWKRPLMPRTAGGAAIVGAVMGMAAWLLAASVARALDLQSAAWFDWRTAALSAAVPAGVFGVARLIDVYRRASVEWLSEDGRLPDHVDDPGD